MKTDKSVSKIILLLLAVLLSGCPNDSPLHMYTKVYPDGSCSREFIRSADSAFVIKGDTSHNPFPMKLDSTWKLSFYQQWEGDTSRFADLPAGKTYKTDSGEFTWFATAFKHYPSVKEMAESFRFNDSDWKNVITEVKFKKRFRWFYTYYDYLEIYPKSNRFDLVPISNYLTATEVSALYGEDKELYRGKNGFEILNELKSLNDKADKWLDHSLYEEMFRVYLENYSGLKNVPVDSQAFAMEKDTIFKYYINTDSIEFDQIGDVLNHHFHTTAYTGEEFEEKMEVVLGNLLMLSGMEVNYQLSVPGKVIETNAPFMLGDTLSWKVDDERFFLNDYAITVISRKPNYWAFAVTVIIIFAAVTGFFIKRKSL